MRLWEGFSAAFGLALMVACGGGGGGTATTTQPASSLTLSVFPDPIIRDQDTAENNPGLQVAMTIDNWQGSTNLYFNLQFSTQCLADISFIPGVEGNTAYASVTFKNPWALGEGTYSDTLEVQVATDPQGVNQIVNSPWFIPVTYTVFGPAILDISPKYVHAGDPDTTFTFTGYGFVPETVIYYEYGNVSATYLSPTVVTARIPASWMSTAGGMDMFAEPGTEVTNQLAVPILAPGTDPPTLTPNHATAGGPDLTLTITGINQLWFNFNAGTQVQWNADWLATNVVSPTELTAVLPAAEIQEAGQSVVYVTVTGGIWEWFDFTVNAAGTVQSEAGTGKAKALTASPVKTIRRMFSRPG
jgi:hypothetical protein